MKKVYKLNSFSCFVAAISIGFVSASQAEINYRFNGFGTIAVGKVLSGSTEQSSYVNYTCPCFITDYNNGGIYQSNENWSFKEETRVGAQLNIDFTDKLSFVTQVMARAVDSKLSVEWAYLSYDLSNKLTFQVGRKRIPLYYYSEFQDVGFAYAWLRPPQTLYGWEASNYNGANLRFSDTFKDWDITANIYAGSETVKNAPYNALYDEVPQDSKWTNIRGIDVEFTKDWFTARLIYMTSKNSTTERPDSNAFYSPATDQTVMGLSLNGDFGDWFILSEMNVNKREDKADNLTIRSPASMIGVGYRIGKWTPFISWSRFWDKSNDLDLYEPERFTDSSITLRYDINNSSSIKAQVNRLKDSSLYNFVGDTTVAALSYDFIF
ncbi:hypothetical protein GCM10010919_03740 [Alishewanella longhuensis]|uniref:Porin n=1 Tax=Alishewanella longhuensis TaxID=1091037 RepID=A0ABQ3KU28_9ALTE|nr:hypothetical protein [Alishewanella longhuensis]GHG60344.1 hypothetical protein GCM10010919_03740 [Alishewanella longhuensis]